MASNVDAPKATFCAPAQSLSDPVRGGRFNQILHNGEMRPKDYIAERPFRHFDVAHESPYRTAFRKVKSGSPATIVRVPERAASQAGEVHAAANFYTPPTWAKATPAFRLRGNQYRTAPDARRKKQLMPFN